MPIKGFSYIPYDIETLDVDAISRAMYLSCVIQPHEEDMD